MNYFDEAELSKIANKITKDKPLDLILVCTGILHTDSIQPEKSIIQIEISAIKEMIKIKHNPPNHNR